MQEERFGQPAASVAVEQVTRTNFTQTQTSTSSCLPSQIEDIQRMAANINPAPTCLKADVWEHFGFKKKKESNDLDKSIDKIKELP